MAHILAAVMVLVLAGGAMTAGSDLMEMMVRMAQVATERLTLSQIGKSVMMFNLQSGRRLTYAEFHKFVRQNVTRGGSKDPAKDIWNTLYWLETTVFSGFRFPVGGDQFVVWSAGPDRKWRSVDDEYWFNFHLEPQYEARLPKKESVEVTGDLVTAKYKKYREQTAEHLGKLGKLLGLGGSDQTTQPAAGQPAPVGTGQSRNPGRNPNPGRR